ncbi:MAG: type II secretion system protein, partial [Patescibacteria group bacterium]
KLRKISFKSGFTVLETIVAFAIISLAIGGVFGAVRTGLVGSIISKDETRGYFLAQEAIEVLRQKRDGNKLTSINTGVVVNWLSGISENSGTDPCRAGAICRLDPQSLTLTYCGASWGSCPDMLQDATSYLYNHTSGNATRYKREIQVECTGACSSATEAQVTIRVAWTKGVNNYELKVKTLMVNWR